MSFTDMSRCSGTVIAWWRSLAYSAESFYSLPLLMSYRMYEIIAIGMQFMRIKVIDHSAVFAVAFCVVFVTIRQFLLLH